MRVRETLNRILHTKLRLFAVLYQPVIETSSGFNMYNDGGKTDPRRTCAITIHATKRIKLTMAPFLQRVTHFCDSICICSGVNPLSSLSSAKSVNKEMIDKRVKLSLLEQSHEIQGNA